MEISFLDLRYKIQDVLKALMRREEICITYHNKLVGTIIPAKKKNTMRVQDHKLFGMFSPEINVRDQMYILRKAKL